MGAVALPSFGSLLKATPPLPLLRLLWSSFALLGLIDRSTEQSVPFSPSRPGLFFSSPLSPAPPSCYGLPSPPRVCAAFKT